MKLFLFMSVILLLGFTSCNSSNYEVEDVLYQCMVDKFAEKEVDLEKELEKFQSYLIEEKILANESEEAYSLLYSKMTGFPPMKIIIDYDRFNSLYVVELDELISKNCIVSIDSSVIKKSKVFQLEQELIKYSMNQKTTKFKSIFEVYESVIGVEEYKHPYYKSKVLLTALYLANIEAGIPKTIPVDLKSNNSSDCYDCKKITVEVDSINNIVISNNVISIDKLEKIVTDLVVENAPNYRIIINADMQASVNTVFEVLALLKKVVSDIRDKKSLEKFSSSYSELDEEAKKVIDKFYPHGVEF